MVGLLGGQLEAARNVDLACGGELVVGPQAHALVAGCACEAEALVDEPRAEPLPASLGGDEQDPQDGGVGIAWVGDAEDASDALACELRYPGSVSYTHLDVYKRQASVLALGGGAALPAAMASPTAASQIKSVFQTVLTAEYFGPASSVCSHLTAKGVAEWTSYPGNGHTCIQAFDLLRHDLTHRIAGDENSGYSTRQWRSVVHEIVSTLTVSVHGESGTAVGQSGIPGETALVDINGHWTFNSPPPIVSS